MGGTRFGRRTRFAIGTWLMRALGALMGLSVVGPAFAEDVVIPYECDVRMGEVRLVPSEPRSYRILGARDRQVYSACDPQDPGQCKNYQVHRFDVECGGTRVPWLKIAEAAARLDGERVSVKRNQMLLEMAAPQSRQDEPYPDGRWDPDRRNSGDPYGVARGEAVVSFPPGFAPALGMKPVFTGRDPALANQLPPTQGVTSGKGGASGGFGVPYDAADEGGWETQAKGWSQSPRGEPLDRDAETGWDADRVIASGEGTPKPAAKHAETGKGNAALAGSKTAGASYGTETVTSQQLPEIGSGKPKSADASKKPASADAAKAAQKKPQPKASDTASAEQPKTETQKAQPEKFAAAKAEAKPETSEAPVAKAPVAKTEPSKPEGSAAGTATAEPAKVEPPKAEAVAASAERSSPSSAERSSSSSAERSVDKTNTAMLETPKEPKADVKPEVRADVPPQTAAPVSEAPQMLNGKDAAAADPAKPEAPQSSAAQQTTAEATPVASPPAVSAPQEPVAAPLPPATADAKTQQPGGGSTVVAEATLKPEQTSSAIETSSISIVGQQVPVLPALALGAAALFTAAGFFFMMKRGEENDVFSYVERDLGRVSLGANGEAASRMAGPSFELPMPGFAQDVASAPESRPLHQPDLSFAPALGAVEPVSEIVPVEATMAETARIEDFAPVDDGYGADISPGEMTADAAVEANPTVAADRLALVAETLAQAEPELAPEAIELVRALSDPAVQLSESEERA